MNPDPLFPGFKVSPLDPSREVKQRPLVTFMPNIDEHEPGPEDNDDSEPTCSACDGWGYFDCFCGGDLCVCNYGGERPCWECC